MNIKKIVLQSSGFKGAHVTYLRQEEKNGHPFVNEVIEKRKHPIHLSLETMFKDLRFYLVDITGLLRGDEDKMTKDYTIQETEVVGIEFDSESFIISGEKKVFDGKTFKLKTCKVQEGDDYAHYETVQKLIASIVEETKEYLAGTKKVDDVEVALRWVQSSKAKGVTPETLETIKGYSAEQLKEFATKLLENQFGACVMLNEDMNISEVDVTAANEEIAAAEKEMNNVEIVEAEFTEEHFETSVPITEEDVIIPLPKSKKEKKEIAAKIIGDTAVNLDAEPVIKPAF